MYFQLRVTPEAFKCPFDRAILIVKSIMHQYDIDEECYITADEKLNKYGEEIKRHFHFNFICEGKKDTIQKYIRKWYHDRDYVCKGNKCYSLVEVEEPDDIKRWLRYLMKEKYLGKLTRIPYPPEEIKEMELLAKDERSRNKELNLKKREQLLKKKTYIDGVFEKLEKEGLRTEEDIFCFIAKCYVQDGCPNHTTIMGYTHRYMLQNGLKTYRDYYLKR